MRKIATDKDRDVLIVLIISALLLFTFHFFRLLKTDIAPLYDQHAYDNINHLIPFAVSFLNIILLYFILEKLLKEKDLRLPIMIMLVMSPVFLFVYGTQNGIFFPLVFLLFGAYLLLSQNYLLGGLSLIGSFLLNQNFSFVIIVLLVIFIEKVKSKNLALPAALLMLLAVVYSLLYKINISSSIHLLFTEYIADFGANIGIGIFSLVLAFLGFLISWKDKSQNAIIYMSIAVLAFMSLFNSLYVVFVDLGIAFFSGYGLFYLYNRKWASENLKNYVLVLILCTLIFTSGSYIKRISESGPYHEEVLSLEWLSEQEEGLVLSDYRYGFLIRKFSSFEPYTDMDYYSSSDKSRIRRTDYIFQSRELEDISAFLGNNNIKYIWISAEMKDEIWASSEDGILLILQNSRHFERIYNFKGVEIWKYDSTEPSSV